MINSITIVSSQVYVELKILTKQINIFFLGIKTQQTL